MFKVTKVIQFCYGHRLLNYEGKCRYLHGHNARVEVELSAAGLDRRGMVMDFVEVKQRLQGWIDSELDHKMILNRADPILPALATAKESVVLFEGNPTAEALARFVYDHAKSEGFPVNEVRFWETPTSFASYSKRGRDDLAPSGRFQRLHSSSLAPRTSAPAPPPAAPGIASE